MSVSCVCDTVSCSDTVPFRGSQHVPGNWSPFSIFAKISAVWGVVRILMKTCDRSRMHRSQWGAVFSLLSPSPPFPASFSLISPHSPFASNNQATDPGLKLGLTGGRKACRVHASPGQAWAGSLPWCPVCSWSVAGICYSLAQLEVLSGACFSVTCVCMGWQGLVRTPSLSSALSVVLLRNLLLQVRTQATHPEWTQEFWANAVSSAVISVPVV